MIVCRICNDERVVGVGCRCTQLMKFDHEPLVGEKIGNVVFKPRTLKKVADEPLRHPDAHLGADQARFETGWHPDFDEGMEHS